MATYGNKQKHESKNPAQRALLGHFKAQVVRIVREIQPRTLLEVGCGEGYMLEALADWRRRSFLKFVSTRFEVLGKPIVFPWSMALTRLRDNA